MKYIVFMDNWFGHALIQLWILIFLGVANQAIWHPHPRYPPWVILLGYVAQSSRETLNPEEPLNGGWAPVLAQLHER